MVRYFCVVGPTGLQVSDLGFSYLQEMVSQHVRVRALPIGASGAFCSERRWYMLGDAFTRPMSLPFINVVCARCGDTLGTRMPAARFARADAVPPELREVLGPIAERTAIEYEPQTVIAGLFTINVKNVAIITGAPDEHETVALRAYDAVICAQPRAAEVLAACGVKVTTTTDFVGMLEELAGVELTDTPPPAPSLAEAPTDPLIDPETVASPSWFSRVWGWARGIFWG